MMDVNDYPAWMIQNYPNLPNMTWEYGMIRIQSGTPNQPVVYSIMERVGFGTLLCLLHWIMLFNRGKCPKVPLGIWFPSPKTNICWRYIHVRVSWNGGTPSHHPWIIFGCSLLNHPAIGVPLFQETSIWIPNSWVMFGTWQDSQTLEGLGIVRLGSNNPTIIDIYTYRYIIYICIQIYTCTYT